MQVILTSLCGLGPSRAGVPRHVSAGDPFGACQRVQAGFSVL